MGTTYLQVYEIPVYHFTQALGWLIDQELEYFTKFGVFNGLIQVAGTTEQLMMFREFLSELWVMKVTTTFPRSQRELVAEELDSWGIPYTRTANPFAFEVVTVIDERKLSRFTESIRLLTKKPKGKVRDILKPKTTVPNDVSSLLD